MRMTEVIEARDQILLSLYNWCHSGRVREIEEGGKGISQAGELPWLRASRKGLEQATQDRSIQMLSKTALHCQTKLPAGAAGATAQAGPTVASSAHPKAGLCAPLGMA